MTTNTPTGTTLAFAIAKARIGWRFLAALTLLYPVVAVAAESGLVFPADGGVLDMRTFGAKPDDDLDDTAAIQQALDQHPNGNRIIYLPPVRWMVRGTLKWPAGARGGLEQKRTILQGAGPSLTILHLPDATPGFADEKPKALIWTGNSPAQRFRNAVRDLTIEVGRGNPGAIGLQFNASNQGTIRNLTLRAAEGSGAIGLDMGFTNEIGPLLVRNLVVEGFEVGISTKWPVNSLTFEQVKLRGQRKFGWWNYHQMIFIRGLDSENAVPAIYNEKDSWGTVTLVDSRITGRNAGDKTPGILNERRLYLRNVAMHGYAKSVDNADKGRDKGDILPAGLIAEDISHKSVAALFRPLPDGTLASAGPIQHLPVKESPVIPWGDSAGDWANLVKFGADPTGKADASAALQAAIDSGAKTVYLPGGMQFRFNGTVEIRGPVERIIGLEGNFHTDGRALWRLVDGRHPRGLPDSRAVILERCGNRSGGAGVQIRHESARTLVVSSWIGADVEGHGSGDMFLDDVCGRLNLYQPGQSAWCRQLNTEHEGTMLRNGREKVRDYGRYVGGRFRDHPNVVLIVGGDFTPPPKQRWTVDELAAGIREADRNRLMTVHYGPNTVAAADYGDRTWLNLNSVYKWQLARLAFRQSRRLRSRRRLGGVPEFTGSAGHGEACGLFPQPALVAAAPRPRERSRHGWYGTSGNTDYVTAARAVDGKLALAYVPATGASRRKLTVDLGRLAGPTTARWFDPTDGR